ncbi:MAG: signal peptidase II [Chloroflexi bacterium]|nr:signal peptidase II [Chloroflexota bacterium]
MARVNTGPAPGDATRRLVEPVVVAVGAGIFVADQLTKLWITAALGPDGTRHQIDLLGEWFRLSYVTNTGAAFGLFQGKTPVLGLASLVAVPFLLFSARLFPAAPLLVRVSLGLLLGGTVGNLVDRVRLGYVVDFLDAGIGTLRWPSFNVADSSFVIGIAILASYLLFLDRPADEPSAPARPPEDRDDNQSYVAESQ